MYNKIESCAASAEMIFRAAVDAAHAGRAVKNVLTLQHDTLRFMRSNGTFHEHPLHPEGKLFILGAGKATAAMARAVEEILGARISDGVISVKYGHTESLRFIRQMEASHPVPDAAGVEAARSIMQCAALAGEKDLVIVLISGGASALLPYPAEGISLEDTQKITQLLLSCGADIKEINSVRKHFSSVTGGLLARAAYPAAVVSLCVSDVIGDDFSVIGSGPCSPDSSTFQDARDVIHAYSLDQKIPQSVCSRFRLGEDKRIPETPKADDICFTRTENIICMSNAIAMRAAGETASALGFDMVMLPSSIEGDTTDAALYHAEIVRGIICRRHEMKKPAAIISGGETTVQVKGTGLGGRNTEFVLRCALALEAERGICIASAGTDGTDGPTDAAGAWMTPERMQELRSQGIAPEACADNNDSYRYFRDAGTLIRTGPTGTNVLDIRIILVYPLNET